MPLTNELTQSLGRFEELIGKLEKTGDPALRGIANELVRLLMEIHRAGLERILEIASQSGPAGMEIIDRVGQEEPARSLLLIHGLHPLDLETRVGEGLDSIRPYLQSRQSDVELIRVNEGVVEVRLLGKAHGCTATTLKSVIEEALNKSAPDLVSLHIQTESDGAASVFIPIGELRTLSGSAG